MTLTMAQINKTFKFVNEVPQPSMGRPRNYTTIYNKLRAKPGRWAIVANVKDYNSALTLAASLRTYGLSVRTRQNSETGSTGVYACFNRAGSIRPAAARKRSTIRPKSKKRR